MLLRRLKYRSNASRHSILQKNFMENIQISRKVILHNKKKKNLNIVLGGSRFGKVTFGTCSLNLQPSNNFLCAGIKTTTSMGHSYGIFYNSNTIFFNSMKKGLDFFKPQKCSLNITEYSSTYGGNSENYVYSCFLNYGTKVFCIYMQNYSILYRSSGGNFVSYIRCLRGLGISVFRLPSSKKIHTPSLVICHIGRNIGIFNKYRVFGSFKFCNLKKKKKISTRGVAMNPVDHPNGGRSKSKTPFYNKYNRLAKKGK